VIVMVGNKWQLQPAACHCELIDCQQHDNDKHQK